MIDAKTKFSNAIISENDNGLNEIHKKSKNIAIRQRNISAIRQEIDLVVSQEIEYRTSGSKKEIIDALSSYFKENLNSSRHVLEDIVHLLQQYEQLTEAKSFRLSFATVNTNMCRRFHTDINTLRMLCTYYGPGTLWLPNEAINMKAYHSGDNNSEIVSDQSMIQQADTGDIVILKGALYPDANPILHRSPTIEENGENRLLLRIDATDSLNFWS
jgi:hypothetical protein